MTYQTEDTQPQRTSLAWTRTSVALVVATLWVCRAAFVSGSAGALLVILLSISLLLVHLIIVLRRKYRLQNQVNQATSGAWPKLILMMQVVLVACGSLML